MEPTDSTTPPRETAWGGGVVHAYIITMNSGGAQSGIMTTPEKQSRKTSGKQQTSAWRLIATIAVHPDLDDVPFAGCPQGASKPWTCLRALSR